jgi:Nitronate monooxygenase
MSLLPLWDKSREYVMQVQVTAIGAIRLEDVGPEGDPLDTVGSAEGARGTVASGVPVAVAQGWEAGGHVWSQVATLPLVPAVVDAVAPVPVIATGGVGACPPCLRWARKRRGSEDVTPVLSTVSPDGKSGTAVRQDSWPW